MADAEENRLPPVPKWRPDFAVPLDEQLERMIYYTDNHRDIAVFRHGTMVILRDGLSDDEAKAYAQEVLLRVYNYHPDMNPVPMDDGNILIQYNHPAYNVVIAAFAEKHMEEIRKNHQDGLAESEVLVTPLGPNKFDESAMKALYGRTFMFMDAQSPEVVGIYRCKAANRPN